jgi:hypothetical protein
MAEESRVRPPVSGFAPSTNSRRPRWGPSGRSLGPSWDSTSSRPPSGLSAAIPEAGRRRTTRCSSPGFSTWAGKSPRADQPRKAVVVVLRPGRLHRSDAVARGRGHRGVPGRHPTARSATPDSSPRPSSTTFSDRPSGRAACHGRSRARPAVPSVAGAAPGKSIEIRALSRVRQGRTRARGRGFAHPDPVC